MLYTLLGVLALLSVARAQPSAGDCLCFSDDSVNIRDAGCGNVIGSANTGACFTATGGAVNCDLSGTNYDYWEFEYTSSNGWSASDYLVSSPASDCEVPDGNCDNINIISRAEWGARPPTSTSPLYLPVDMYFVHHSAGASCSTQSECSAQVRSIQDYHMDSNGWNDIGYNFLIGGDGNVYEGRGWDTLGAHTGEWNDDGYGVCMIGTFTSSLPVQSAMDALAAHIGCAVQLGNMVSTYSLHGHRDAMATECPGQMLYDEISTWPNFGGPV